MRLEDLSGYVAELDHLVKFEVKTEDDTMGHLVVVETKETFVFDDEEDAKKSSIFLVIKDNTIKDETMRVEYDVSKITISLPGSQWDLYDKNKKMKRLENLYFSIIAIPALTQCISELQKPENTVEGLCLEYRWFNSFKKQYEAINGCELTDDTFMKMNAMVEAQKLLNTPTTKSIDDIFKEIVMKEIGGSEND